MKKQEYLVGKVNKEKLIYRTDYYETYREAWNALRKNDILLVCKKGSIYWNGFEWDCKNENIIRETKRR